MQNQTNTLNTSESFNTSENAIGTIECAKSTISYDEIDKMYEIIDQFPKSSTYIPTVDDLKKHGVEENPVPFLPYLFWISEIIAGSKLIEHKKLNRYIVSLTNNCVN